MILLYPKSNHVKHALLFPFQPWDNWGDVFIIIQLVRGGAIGSPTWDLWPAPPSTAPIKCHTQLTADLQGQLFPPSFSFRPLMFWDSLEQLRHQGNISGYLEELYYLFQPTSVQHLQWAGFVLVTVASQISRFF